MKKVMMIAIAAVFVFASSAAHAEKVKDVVEKSNNFWAKEGERSGLKESTSSWGQFWSNINPGKYFQDQQSAYNSRKGSMTK